MKVGIFSDAFNTAGKALDIKYEKVGRNSGNLVFLRSIAKLFDPIFINPAHVYAKDEEKYSDIDAFISTDLIWIRPNTKAENVERIFKNIGNRPLIPISVGLQADSVSSGFVMHKDTAKLLQGISERCTVGVRGYYAASVLNKYGIKNIAVIGCPSVFYKESYQFKEPSSHPAVKAVSSFRTAFYPEFERWCSEKELEYLLYCQSYDMGLVEQTGFYEISPESELEKWINERRKMFFDIKEWDNYLRGYDFHIGMRFHGGVISMQNGLRSLFLTLDSRTTELTDFFCLPKLPIGKFDSTKPLKYYYDLADYSEFEKRFPYLKDNLRAFSAVNGLKVNL